MGIKALATAVLQGNQRRNHRETQSFLANKPRKPERQSGKPGVALPQWQHDFCLAHGMFNNWCGICPCSIDDCLISKIIDSGGNIDNLRKLEIGQGVTTDMVVNKLIEEDEPVDCLLSSPVWWVCLAESLKYGKNTKH